MSKKTDTAPATPAVPKVVAATAAPAINIDAMKATVVSAAHVAANLFPMMAADELQNLCISMRQSGFNPLHPIKRSKGMITDGRNRELASRIVNAEIELWNADPANKDEIKSPVTPVYVDEASDNEADILHSVMDDNFTRRHMTPGQKAAVIVKAGILAGAYQKRDELGASGKRVAGHVAGMIAEQHGVNHDYIYKCKAIAKNKKLGRELLAAIASGEKTVMAAYAEINAVDTPNPVNNGDTADEILDGNKKPVPEDFKEIFRVRAKYGAVAKCLRDAKKLMEEIAASVGGTLLAEGNNLKEAKAGCNACAKALRSTEPFCVCPHCEGDGKHPTKGDKFPCPLCVGSTIVTEIQHENYLKNGVLEAEEGAADADKTAEPVKAKKTPKAKKTTEATEPADSALAATGAETPAEEPAAV